MIKVFLGDLVHTWEKVSLWTFPLNVGYIGAYADKHLPGELEIRLFKRPEKMIEAIREENPDVVALAHYVWNSNLNAHVFDIAKSHNPNILCVGGGPNFTSINAVHDVAQKWFAANPSCDAFVVNQGERGFLEVMKTFKDSGGRLDEFSERMVDGAMVNRRARGDVTIGPALDIIRDLDEIPSPYLNGMLDEFFDEPFIPVLETNRSCPYRCTFCAWGIGTGKLAKFSDERVLSEIDYFSKRTKKSANLYIADANFAVLDRDATFAERMRHWHDEIGYPGHVVVQWNKTRPDRVLRVAKAFRGIAEVGASMQSLTPAVLDAIKRRNLPLETVAEMNTELRDEGIDMTLFSELILGLPEETRESHLEANRKLIDVGAEVFNYNLHLLPGTEMDSPKTRAQYFKKTVWRLHDNAFGIYDGEKVIEGQEVVDATSTMSSDELRAFRLIHFLIQFMWSRKWYYDFLQLFRHAGVHPVDMIVAIAEAMRSDDGAAGEIYKRFATDHAVEAFKTREELRDYWTQDENMERLRTGEYGKLNYVFTYLVLLEYYEPFNDLLLRVAREAIGSMVDADQAAMTAQVEDILKFTRELRISLNMEANSVVDRKQESFRYDILSWRESGYSGQPAPISTSSRMAVEFYLGDRQRRMLDRQYQQFKSHNVNLTLRKMSEEISADLFFYRVRPGAESDEQGASIPTAEPLTSS